MKRYCLRFKLGFSLLCLFLFSLCITLGVWQLHRYAYKKTLLMTYQERLKAAPKAFKDIAQTNDLQFQSVSVQGNYRNDLTLLIQNRFYHDELGFEVFTPLQIPHDKKLLLIDRGWIKKSELNSLANATSGKQKITGHLKLLNEYQFILGANILEPDKKPLVLQRMDVNDLNQVTHELFYPFILQLNANEPNGYVRNWTITTIPPARHMAYAVQWFALALVLIIGYFCFCCEEVKEKKV